MVPKRARDGQRAVGLLYYLYGPGKADEHTNPHLVGAWDEAIISHRDPAVSETATLPDLARLLEAPVEAMDGTPAARHVYHVPVRLDPGDRELSDAEWSMVAREILDAANIAPRGDPDRSCRWVAVRHADDHIHIVATLATESGRRPELWQDKTAMQQRARELEQQLGLRRLGRRDRTARTWPTQAELAKAARKGRSETPRATLQMKVRQAAAGARGQEDFFVRLGRAGVRVQQRVAPDGAVTGYSVALPGDRTAAGRAVWYSGSRLAPDLSLPRVRERWAQGAASPSGRPTTRAEAWQQAAGRIEQAAVELSRSGDAAGAGMVAALGDVLTTYATDAPRLVRGEIQAAAVAFERAARAPAASRAVSQGRQHLTEATSCLMLSATMAGGGNETAAAVALLSAVALAVVAAQRWHQAKGHRMQAESAGAAARHLRAASEVTAGAVSGGDVRADTQRRSPSPGRRSDASAEVRERCSAVVWHVLPDYAQEVLRDEAWPALIEVLDGAERAGFDATKLLRQVAGQRELSSAESVAQVLTWRVQGRMRREEKMSSTSQHAAPKPKKVTAAQRATQDRPKSAENRPRGPHR